MAKAKRPAVKSPFVPNRFRGLSATCPRCVRRVRAEKYIVNLGVNGAFGLFATFACPACGDVVQVSMELESEANVAPRNSRSRNQDHT